jgi:hypothetical protein
VDEAHPSGDTENKTTMLCATGSGKDHVLLDQASVSVFLASKPARSCSRGAGHQ